MRDAICAADAAGTLSHHALDGMVLQLQAHNQGTMPDPYKEVWHNLMALLARDTRMRHEIDLRKQAVHDAAATAPVGGLGHNRGTQPHDEPSLPPSQHREAQLMVPSAPQQRQQQQQQQEATPCTSTGDRRPEADTIAHSQLAAMPPKTPTAAGCPSGDARASLSGDDVPMAGDAAASGSIQGTGVDVARAGRLALPAPPPQTAVHASGATHQRSSKELPSAACSGGDGGRTPAETVRSPITTATAAPERAASVPGPPGHGIGSQPSQSEAPRRGSEPLLPRGVPMEQLPGASGRCARYPADEQGAWLHQHALPWPPGGIPAAAVVPQVCRPTNTKLQSWLEPQNSVETGY